MISVNLQNITRAVVNHISSGEFHEPFSVVALRADGGEVKLFVTAAQAEAIAAVFAPQVNEAGVPVFESPEPVSTPCCDLCGETGEIRSYPRPFGAAERLCAACFAANDPENSFTDYPLAEEAA